MAIKILSATPVVPGGQVTIKCSGGGTTTGAAHLLDYSHSIYITPTVLSWTTISETVDGETADTQIVVQMPGSFNLQYDSTLGHAWRVDHGTDGTTDIPRGSLLGYSKYLPPAGMNEICLWEPRDEEGFMAYYGPRDGSSNPLVKSGVQVVYDTTTDTGLAVTMYADGEPQIEPAEGDTRDHSFDYFFVDNDGVAGSPSTYTINYEEGASTGTATNRLFIIGDDPAASTWRGDKVNIDARKALMLAAGVNLPWYAYAQSGDGLAGYQTQANTLVADLTPTAGSLVLITNPGGNNFSANGVDYTTWTQVQKDDVTTQLTALLDSLVNAGFRVALTNLSYRTVHFNVDQYNAELIHPLIEQYCPRYYDSVNDKPLLDYYQVSLDRHTSNADYFPEGGGIHPSVTGETVLFNHVIAVLDQVDDLPADDGKDRITIAVRSETEPTTRAVAGVNHFGVAAGTISSIKNHRNEVLAGSSAILAGFTTRGNGLKSNNIINPHPLHRDLSPYNCYVNGANGTVRIIVPEYAGRTGVLKITATRSGAASNRQTTYTVGGNSQTINCEAVVPEMVEFPVTVDGSGEVLATASPAGSTYSYFSVATLELDAESTPDDTTVDQFELGGPVTNATLSTNYNATQVTLSGATVGVSLTVTPTNGAVSVNGGTYTTSPTTAVNGDTLDFRVTSSASNSTTVVGTLAVNGVSDTYSVTTVAANDTTPTQFELGGPVTNATLSTFYNATQFTIAGTTAGVSLTVTPTNGQVSIAGGAYTSSPTTAVAGNTVNFRVTSSGSYSTTVTGTLDINGVSDTYAVTTAAADTTPAAFELGAAVTNATLSTVYNANQVTISGASPGVNLTVTPTNGQVSVNGGTYTGSATTAQNGNTLDFRVTSSASYGTGVTGTLDVSGVSDTFTVTTLAADTTPDQFDLGGPRLDAETSTGYYSAAITVMGLTTGSSATATPSGSQLRVNGGTLTSSPTAVQNGDTVEIRVVSSASYETTTTGTLNINGITDTYSVTTKEEPVVIPDPPVMGADASVSVVENTTSVGTFAALSGNSVTYTIGGMDGTKFVIDTNTAQVDFLSAPDFDNPSDFDENNVYQLAVVGTDPDGQSDVQNVTVTVTNVIDNTTVLPFNIPDVTGSERNTEHTVVVSINGPEDGATVTVTNGEISNDGGSTWGTSPVTFVSGQTRLRATLTSSNNLASTVSVLVSANGTGSIFSVTTKGSNGNGNSGRDVINSPFSPSKINIVWS